MNWPRGWLPLTDAAIEMIRTSTRRLDIMNYYIGDATVIREILAAARRGVHVRLVIADKAHANAVTYRAFLHMYDEMLAAGIEIWEYPAVVHAKVIVADDRVLIGTLNLDAWAMYRNPEMGLQFDDAIRRRAGGVGAVRARHRKHRCPARRRRGASGGPGTGRSPGPTTSCRCGPVLAIVGP